MGTNLRAPLFLAQAAAPALRKSQGAIVNIADIHAERPLKNYVVYSVAKAGLVALTRSLARELAPEVRVNAVAPGPILWPDDDVVRRSVAPADHLAHAAEARRNARRHRQGRALPARRRDLRHRRDDQRRRRTAHRDLKRRVPLPDHSRHRARHRGPRLAAPRQARPRPPAGRHSRRARRVLVLFRLRRGSSSRP